MNQQSTMEERFGKCQRKDIFISEFRVTHLHLKIHADDEVILLQIVGKRV